MDGEFSVAWIGRLARTDKGAFQATCANAMVILGNDPTLCGLLAFNEFTSQHLIMRAAPPPDDSASGISGPYPRSWGTEDVTLVQAYLQRIWSPKFNRQTTEEAMFAEAKQRPFHPVRDWLAELCWDGRPRIDTWLINTFACDDTPYIRAVGTKILIAAVRRVRQPGIKFDHMPVLEGPQGIGKSSVCRALVSAPWFSDALPPDLGSRDAALALLGLWCLEFAEIEHLIRQEPETIKAFLSRSVDRYRPPYSRGYVERPRQCIFIGTTNSNDYLRDSSGNRRIWPIKCEAASVEWVEIHRDQLWAEAALREAQDESIWIQDDLTQVAATEAQGERMAEDVWEDVILPWLSGRSEIKIFEILTECLNIPKERQTRREQLRVAAILRGAGWVRHVYKPKGQDKPIRVWLAPLPKDNDQEEAFRW